MSGPALRASSLLAHARNGDSVFGLKLFVCGSGLHGRTLLERVLHFRFEAAVAKRSELHTFAVIAQRWVVKRSFARAGEEPKAVEKLRAQAQHQFAIYPPRLPVTLVMKIVNGLLSMLRALFTG
jgi:hypothetical protein